MSPVLRPFASITTLSLAFALAACGGGGSSGAPQTPDTNDPNLGITYPSEILYTDDTQITITGTATDDYGVSSVMVNGIPATSTDNFATWSAIISLQTGTNVVDVTATDFSANIAVESITIESRSPLTNTTNIAYDSNHQRLLMLEDSHNALYSVNLLETTRRVVSAPAIPNSNNPFSGVKDLAIDNTGDNIFIADSYVYDRLLRVNLTTGERTIITQDSEWVAAHTLIEPTQLEIDTNSQTVYILDSRPTGGGRGEVLQFNLTTGVTTVLSNPLGYDPETDLTWPNSLALDTSHNRILVCDAFRRVIITIDLATGVRTILSSENTPDISVPFIDPTSLIVDAANNRALLLEARTKSLIAVNLDSGVKSMLATNLAGLDGLNVFQQGHMVLDSANNRVLIVTGANSVYAISLTNGAQSVLSNYTIPNSNNPLNQVTGITLDSVNNRALVTSTGNDAVIAVDLSSGARTIVSNSSTPDATNSLDNPNGISIDAANNRALLVDAGLDALIAVNLSTGARTLLSSSYMPDTNNTFNQIVSLAHDETNNRLVILDAGRKSLIGVNLATTERTVISSPILPNGDNPIHGPKDIVLQAGDAFILDDWSDAIFRVNLSTGARTVLSAAGIPNNSNNFSRPSRMIMDASHSRLLVLDSANGLHAVIAVNLTDGSRTILSDSTTPNSSNAFNQPIDITLDIANNRALVTDNGLDQIIAVDLTTGARSIVYGGLFTAF